MKIGIYGGTFDPPHLGHLIVAEYVRTTLGLDQIVFVPVATAPHKQGLQVTDGRHRLAMLERAVASNPTFSVSDEEIRRGGVSYTVDTLAALRAAEPEAAFFVLIGADNALEFDTWKDPEGIRAGARIVVMDRPGVALDEEALARRIPGAVVVRVPGIEIAAREIRRSVAKGRSIRYRVPDAVREYVLENGLYR
jgi:nicotinate-nucleotide adenylyltransferase